MPKSQAVHRGKKSAWHLIRGRRRQVTLQDEKGCISYLPIRTPTNEELEHCRWIHLTSDEEWEPYDENFDKAEDVMRNQAIQSQRRYEMQSRDSTGRYVMATSSKDHRSNIKPEELARRWGTSVEVAKTTLKVTTQRGYRNLASPLTRRF